MIFSKKGELAIEPVFASKVEVDASSGFARATARSRVIVANLAFAYEYNGRVYEPGKAKVILPGSAAMQPWAKQEYEMVVDESTAQLRTFVICPEAIVLGFKE